MTVEDDSDDIDSQDDGNQDEAKTRKRKERLEQNRISARESRKRKKTMIEELQRTVITLSRENKDLNERNESLRRQLMEIGAKYPNVVPLQAIVSQGTAQQADHAGSTGGSVANGTTSSVTGSEAATDVNENASQNQANV